MKRIDKALDIGGCLLEIGMGKLEWALTLQRMMERCVEAEDWKYVNAGLKVWGLAQGVFSAQPQGEGASILIGAKAEGSGAQAQVAVRWPQRQLPPVPPEPLDSPEARAQAEAHYRDARLTLESARGGADMPAHTPDTGPDA